MLATIFYLKQMQCVKTHLFICVYKFILVAVKPQVKHV